MTTVRTFLAAAAIAAVGAVSMPVSAQVVGIATGQQGSLGFKTGQALQLPNVPHNRLLLSLAHGFGHPLKTFGNPKLSAGGPLDLG